jgi:hypothetical protein
LPEVKVQIERVEGIRLSEKATEDTAANYTVNVSLREGKRVILPFAEL